MVQAENPEVNSIIDLTELLILVILVLFLALAFSTNEPFLFAVAGFVSVIFGIDLALIYLEDVSFWAIEIIGFIFIMFGVWLEFACLSFSLKKSNRK